MADTVAEQPPIGTPERFGMGRPDTPNFRGQVLDLAAGAQVDIQTNRDQAAALVGTGDPRLQEIDRLKHLAQAAAYGTEVKLQRLEKPYVMSEDLRLVVEAARSVGRPLLLEGEPGCGKTSLAYAIAAEEGKHLIHVQCKSTSTAQELLYTFDHLGRMRDAQLGKDISDPRKYIKLGPLGEAFTADEDVILVIDEVDKAKRDFPNDLLDELEQKSFMIHETGEVMAAKHAPTVFLTTNHEKELPDAALRRCMYHFVEFPSPDHMARIVKEHVPNLNDHLFAQTLEFFYEIRSLYGLRKNPSTSEFIDWMKVLSAQGVKDLQGIAPHLGLLLKNRVDIGLVLEHQKMMAKMLTELGLKREDFTYCYRPPTIKKLPYNTVSRRIVGRDDYGQVIVKLPNGVQYIKHVVSEEEQSDENYYDKPDYDEY